MRVVLLCAAACLLLCVSVVGASEGDGIRVTAGWEDEPQGPTDALNAVSTAAVNSPDANGRPSATKGQANNNVRRRRQADSLPRRINRRSNVATSSTAGDAGFTSASVMDGQGPTPATEVVVMPNALYVPEETNPTVATEGNPTRSVTPAAEVEEQTTTEPAAEAFTATPTEAPAAAAEEHEQPEGKVVVVTTPVEAPAATEEQEEPAADIIATTPSLIPSGDGQTQAASKPETQQEVVTVVVSPTDVPEEQRPLPAAEVFAPSAGPASSEEHQASSEAPSSTAGAAAEEQTAPEEPVAAAPAIEIVGAPMQTPSAAEEQDDTNTAADDDANVFSIASVAQVGPLPVAMKPIDPFAGLTTYRRDPATGRLVADNYFDEPAPAAPTGAMDPAFRNIFLYGTDADMPAPERPIGQPAAVRPNPAAHPVFQQPAAVQTAPVSPVAAVPVVAQPAVAQQPAAAVPVVAEPVVQQPAAAQPAVPIPAVAVPIPAVAVPTPAAAEPTPAAAEPTPAAAEPTPAAAEPTPAAQEPSQPVQSVPTQAEPASVSTAAVEPTPVAAAQPTPAVVQPTTVAAAEPAPAAAAVPVAAEPVQQQPAAAVPVVAQPAVSEPLPAVQTAPVAVTTPAVIEPPTAQPTPAVVEPPVMQPDPAAVVPTPAVQPAPVAQATPVVAAEPTPAVTPAPVVAAPVAQPTPVAAAPVVTAPGVQTTPAVPAVPALMAPSTPVVAEPTPAAAVPTPAAAEPTPAVAEPTPAAAEPSTPVDEPSTPVDEPNPAAEEPSDVIAIPTPSANSMGVSTSAATEPLGLALKRAAATNSSVRLTASRCGEELWSSCEVPGLCTAREGCECNTAPGTQQFKVNSRCKCNEARGFTLATVGGVSSCQWNVGFGQTTHYEVPRVGTVELPITLKGNVCPEAPGKVVSAVDIEGAKPVTCPREGDFVRLAYKRSAPWGTESCAEGAGGKYVLRTTLRGMNRGDCVSVKVTTTDMRAYHVILKYY